MDQPTKPKSSAPKIKFSTTLKNGTVKSIEVPASSSMKSLRVWTFAAGELAIEQDLATLMLLMFREPEATFEYFSEYQQPLDRALSAAIDRGDVLLLKSENYYYKHPSSPRVYLLINPGPGD